MGMSAQKLDYDGLSAEEAHAELLKDALQAAEEVSTSLAAAELPEDTEAREREVASRARQGEFLETAKATISQEIEAIVR